MGCGSSSLKGEEPTGLGSEPAPKPAKRVEAKHQFADVDYDSPANRKKSKATHDQAPHELNERKPSVLSHRSEEPAGAGEDGMIQPYHTHEENGDPAMNAAYPHEKPTRPAESEIDETKTFTSDPSTLSSTTQAAQEPRKKSLFAKLKDTTSNSNSTYGSNGKNTSGGRRANGRQFSDAELMKYTGINNAQMKEKARAVGWKPQDRLTNTGYMMGGAGYGG